MSKNKEERKPVKRRKRRKPMTEEQRLAASERLEKARKERAKKNPDYGMSGIHETLRNLEDNHFLHPKKVKEWIKTQKEMASAERASVRQKIKGAYAKQLIHEGYVRNMLKYLRDGDWVDMFYGEHQEHKIKYNSVVLAYDKNGNPKRTVGVFYNDMGVTYTQEMSSFKQCHIQRLTHADDNVELRKHSWHVC